TELLTNKQGEYQFEVKIDRMINYIDDDSLDYRNDFGHVVKTSDGPVYVYQEIPNQEEKSPQFQLKSVLNDSLNGATVLNDPYDLTYDSESVLYIDFEQGYYFSHSYESDGILRIDIESGEPLYDGA